MFICFFFNRKRFHLMERRSKKEHNSNKKTRKNKLPSSTATRMQNQAPPALKVNTKVLRVEIDPSAAPNAIPLLSPLFLSPVAAVEEAEMNGKGKELAAGGGNEVISEGWKFAAAVEPLKIDALLQSECMLVNNI
ncbi:hypothetical protein ABFX02_04G087800 [Erythranthe guttata]